MTPQRPSRSPAVPAGLVLAVILAAAAAAAAPEGPLELPADPLPASLAALAPLDRAHALAITRDGAMAAAAVPHAEKPKFNVVEIAAEGGPFGEVELRGDVRSLLFDTDHRSLFALVHRVSRKSRVVEAYLAHIDLDTLRTSRSVTLPETSRDLGLWPGGSAVLVACRDEVRTVLLPDVRTGPLFWIVGDNLSLAILAGDDLLVGQQARVVRVNLADPQGRETLPIRESVPAPGPVVDLVASPDGDRALARLDDGRTLDVGLEPLRLEPRARAEAIAWLGSPAPPVSRAPAKEATPGRGPDRPASAAPAGPRDEPRRPDPQPPPAEAAAAGAGTVESPPEADSPATAVPPAQGEITESAGAADSPAPRGEPARPAPPDAPDALPGHSETEKPAHGVPASVTTGERDTGELGGTVTGPAAREVTAVVLLGPDNVLREAARVTPRADGSWLAAGLEPGRYRVLLDAGGGKVVTTRPAFRSATVEAGRRVTVPPVEALRTIER